MKDNDMETETESKNWYKWYISMYITYLIWFLWYVVPLIRN